MNLIVIFLLLIRLHLAISKEEFIKCSFVVDPKYGYTCVLNIYNPTGHNNFAKIDGNHLNRWRNEDVQFIYHSNDGPGFTVNIPSIICETFPNVRRITLRNIGVQRIDNYSFAKCKRLVEILIRNNNIKIIEENCLLENTELLSIQITINKDFKSLPEELYINQYKAEIISLDYNQLTDLPKKIFQNQRALKTLWLSDNHLKQLRPEWFENLERLEKLTLHRNPIEHLPINVFKKLKSLAILKMDNTHLKVLHSSSFGVHPNLKTLNFDSNKIFAVDRLLLKNIHPNPKISLTSNPCGNCFQNYDNSMTVCHREVELLSSFSSNPNLLQAFDYNRAHSIILKVEDENKQLKEEIEELRVMYEPVQPLENNGTILNNEEQNVEKEINFEIEE